MPSPPTTIQRALQRALPGLALVATIVSMGYLFATPIVPASISHGHEGLDPDAPLAAEFALDVLDGTTLSSDSLRGQIVVIDFWATWCVPCIVEIPSYNRLHAEMADRGVTFLGIAVASGDRAAVSAFIRDPAHPVEFPVAMATTEIQRAFGPIAMIPTTLVIGPGWRVHRKWYGAPAGKAAQIRALIEDLLDDGAGRARSAG